MFWFQKCYQVVPIDAPPSYFAYAPHWDCTTQCLLYTDTFANNTPALFRYDPKHNKFFQATLDNGGAASFIVPVHKWPSHYFVGIDRCIYIVSWDGCAAIARRKQTYYCFNDNILDIAKADPLKRLVGGTYMPTLCNRNTSANAILFTINKSQGIQINFNDFYTSAGKDWYQNKNRFYQNTLCDFDTMEYDWNPSTGGLC